MKPAELCQLTPAENLDQIIPTAPMKAKYGWWKRSINRTVSPLGHKTVLPILKTHHYEVFNKKKKKVFQIILIAFWFIRTGSYFQGRPWNSEDLGKNLLYGHESWGSAGLGSCQVPRLTRRCPESAAGLTLTNITERETPPTQPTGQESGGKKPCQNMQCPKACKHSPSWHQGPISSGWDWMVTFAISLAWDSSFFFILEE